MKKPGNIGIMDLPVQKKLGNHEILVKVAYCGICGTDAHIYEGKLPYVQYPIILGHEFSGTVVETGSTVDGLTRGTRVAINPNLSCKDSEADLNYCFYCNKGRPHFCEHWEAIGVTRSGGYADYVICPGSSAFKIPNGVSLKEGAMMEPVACCLHGLSRLGFSEPVDDSKNVVLVIGAGPIGLMMISLLKNQLDVKVIVSEPREYRRNIASRLGAELSINPRNEPLKRIISEMTGGNGVDTVIECVGSSQTLLTGLQVLNKGGNLLLFGVAPPSETVSLSLFNIFRRELTISGSFTNPHENAEALNVLQRKLIDPLQIISHEIPLSELEEGIQLLKTGNVFKRDISKIIVNVQGKT